MTNENKEQTAQQIADEIRKLEKEIELKSLSDKRDKLREELKKEEYVDLTPKKVKSDSEIDFGLPDVETFQKRASKALGADQF